MLGMILPTGSADAQTVKRLEVDSSVLLSENPLLLRDDHRAAGQAEVSLRPSISYKSSDGTTAAADAEISARQYTRRYGNYLLMRGTGTVTQRNSEFLNWGSDARFARELSVDALGTAADAGVDPRSVRTTVSTNAFVSWQPDAFTSIRPEVEFERASFDDTALLGTTRSSTVILAYSRRLSTLTDIGVRGSANWSEVAGAADLATQSIALTINRRLSEGWRLSAQIGGEHVDSRTEEWLGPAVDQRSRWVASGSMQLCWDRSRLNACLSARRATEVSALGGLQRRTTIDTSVGYRLSPSGTLSATLAYSRATVQQGLLAGLEALRAQADYVHRLSATLSLSALVRYARRTLIDGADVDAGFAGLTLSWRPVLP